MDIDLHINMIKSLLAKRDEYNPTEIFAMMNMFRDSAEVQCRVMNVVKEAEDCINMIKTLIEHHECNRAEGRATHRRIKLLIADSEDE